MNADISEDKETYAVIRVAMEVHCELGNGFLEAVYQEAMESEFISRRIPFCRETPIPIHYKGKQLNSLYRADFLCYQSVIVELKAIKSLTEIESAQILHYLKATRFQRGLLINFGTPKLQYKRFIHSSNNLRSSAQSAVNNLNETTDFMDERRSRL